MNDKRPELEKHKRILEDHPEFTGNIQHNYFQGKCNNINKVECIKMEKDSSLKKE